MKLPWQRIKQKPQPELTQLQSEQIGSPPVDPRGVESARGAEILESNNLETIELGALAKLPPFRPVVISLVRLFDRDDVSMDEVAALVQADPTMTSEMLGVVNSPLYGLQQTVSSPARAINLLGTERTKSVAATLAMRSLMQGAPRTPVVRRFWIHSIATATIARHFAKAFGADVELAHVTGLLHDLGRSGLLAAHPEEYARIALASHESAAQIMGEEEAEFGMTHCHAGGLLAKAWRLPEVFAEITMHHHEGSSTRADIALIQLSCRLADDFMYQSINRRDIQKPEATIAEMAPEAIRERLLEELSAVSTAVDAAIQTLDF